VAVRRPAYVLIDEPELNLHPSLQLDFLTTLAGYTSAGILFATHSLGLARAGAEQIYSVRREQQGVSDVRELEGTPELARFLGELSFSSYEELGFDRILLVEGPTEVKLFQRLLRLYGIEHQVVLMPLGGGSLINAEAEAQLRELKRISSNLLAIVDSERSAAGAEPEANVRGFAEACAKAEIGCHVLELRAIENYFPDHAVKATMGESYRRLGV
jgi:energy-coupling factor transporter ATP-binding protein EcfA2